MYPVDPTGEKQCSDLQNKRDAALSLLLLCLESDINNKSILPTLREAHECWLTAQTSAVFVGRGLKVTVTNIDKDFELSKKLRENHDRFNTIYVNVFRRGSITSEEKETLVEICTLFQNEKFPCGY